MEIDRAAERLLRAEEDLLGLLGPKLQAMRLERDGLARKLQKAQDRSAGVDVESLTNQIMTRLAMLAEEFNLTDPSRLRNVLHRMVYRITLYFEQVKQGKRTTYPMLRVDIELPPEPLLLGSMLGPDNRGDRIRTCDFMVPNHAL